MRSYCGTNCGGGGGSGVGGGVGVGVGFGFGFGFGRGGGSGLAHDCRPSVVATIAVLRNNRRFIVRSIIMANKCAKEKPGIFRYLTVLLDSCCAGSTPSLGSKLLAAMTSDPQLLGATCVCQMPFNHHCRNTLEAKWSSNGFCRSSTTAEQYAQALYDPAAGIQVSIGGTVSGSTIVCHGERRPSYLIS